MKTHGPKILVTSIALVLFIIHVWLKAIDATALAIIGIAILPWLASVLDVAELPGGIKIAFAKVKREQERQAQDLAWIKMLITLVVSDYERIHLERLAANGPYMADTNSSFEWELRHLLTLGLIERLPGKGMRSLFKSPGTHNVKEHLAITQRGRDYLHLLDEANV